MSLHKLATNRTTSLTSHLLEAQCEIWTTDPGRLHHEPTSCYIATCQPTPDRCMRDVPLGMEVGWNTVNPNADFHGFDKSASEAWNSSDAGQGRLFPNTNPQLLITCEELNQTTNAK